MLTKMELSALEKHLLVGSPFLHLEGDPLWHEEDHQNGSQILHPILVDV